MGASALQITQGTQSLIAFDNIGGGVGTNYQTVKLDIGAAGLTSAFTGTLGAVTNLAGGTVGILTAGTVDTIGLLHANYFGTVVTSGTSTLGTIKPTIGAGTRIYITDITISAGSATNLVIADGGTATAVIGSLMFAANGGMVANYRSPLRTTQGGTLVFQQSANGPLSITVQGYTAP